MVNLHILGAQKSGTSALAHFLSQHNDVCLVQGKESHVFDSPAFINSNNKMAFAKTQFAKRLAHSNGEKYQCDATPITLYNETFLRHCFAFNPKAKFVVILRDPVQRACSHYHMSKGRNQEPSNMLWAFLSEQKRLQRHFNERDIYAWDAPFRTQSYLTRGLYKRQLSALYSIIPAQQVHVIWHHDLQARHQDTINHLLAFLDIAEQDIPDEKVFVSTSSQATFSDQLAKLYAEVYFRWHGETQQVWDDLIRRSNQVTGG